MAFASSSYYYPYKNRLVIVMNDIVLFVFVGVRLADSRTAQQKLRRAQSQCQEAEQEIGIRRSKVCALPKRIFGFLVFFSPRFSQLMNLWRSMYVMSCLNCLAEESQTQAMPDLSDMKEDLEDTKKSLNDAKYVGKF